MSEGCLILWCITGLLFISYLPANGKTKTPKTYIVNLDVEPEQRWHHVALDYSKILKAINTVISAFIPNSLKPYINRIAEDIDNYLPYPYAGEIRGFAKSLNMTVEFLVMANLLYDVSAFCTSIVAQDANGQIWHSRNLDYGFATILKNITITVDFQSRGQTVYSMVTYAGYVGAMTGQRPKMFTVTINERDQGSILMNLVLGLLDRSVVPVTFLIRDALANDTSFEAAVRRLAYTHTAAGAYFIVGGVKPGEGVVITKGRLSPDDIWRLDPEHGRWFLVETNYDHWTNPPPGDNRRGPAMKAMTTLGKTNISIVNMFNVMSTPKVLNSLTIYTTVMSAAKPSLMKSWIRL